MNKKEAIKSINKGIHFFEHNKNNKLKDIHRLYDVSKKFNRVIGGTLHNSKAIKIEDGKKINLIHEDQVALSIVNILAINEVPISTSLRILSKLEDNLPNQAVGYADIKGDRNV
ncbi:hypothetical protein [Apilactobacillus xinyiensis]|uniref:hypothetical protein n=1 Tax=Apilactobacillus xinyiensis TaxID=2841032 RepID=UPI001C7DDE10|nr:hypothetical protein [Apilactobacillus xinyiensis]